MTGSRWEQWLPEENLEQGSADYEELAANNGVVVTDAEDHLLSMFYAIRLRSGMC